MINSNKKRTIKMLGIILTLIISFAIIAAIIVVKIFNNSKPILTVTVGDKIICSINKSELPVEKTPTIKIEEVEQKIVFEDSQGNKTIHKLKNETGWFAFSVRVFENLICLADCIYGDDKNLTSERFNKGEINGIRFQPFFLCDARAKQEDLNGRSLFSRGLHFSGTITPGNLSLSCICDKCGESFRLHSFHAGFSMCGYMYSESGMYTIIIPSTIEGAPPALGAPDIKAISKLEKRLPMAPDGTSFKYLNPLRCPHCKSPYLDFEKFPKDREHEYYGNTFFGQEAIEYEEK